MDNQNQELHPQELLKHAKKHPHSVNVSTQAFTVNSRDFVVHNISLKGDPNGDFDIVNYRRGLTFIQQIINFKEQNLRVGKKGLRKFFDLMPEFLGEKSSHISNSKHYNSIKNKIFSPIDNQAESFFIYSTEKANGQNAQISWDQQGKFWVIGSKNKTLLLAQLKDIKYLTHKYEHVRTITIAEQWFKFLQANPQKLEAIKEKLSKYVLIGEICDSVKSGHIVDYGQQIKLYFYALVGKEQRQHSCDPPAKFLEFVKSVNLQKYCVKFNITEVKTYQALKQQLKKQMYRVYEGQLEKYGEGTVVYITINNKGIEQCESICKIKTLQYRIYRKLREKLKLYFEKFRKSYDKMLNKFIQEVKQLTKGFNTPKPEEYYFNIGRRAFQFCQNQQKAITKYFHNKYVQFLKLVQNQKIDRETFKKIVHQEIGSEQINKMQQSKQQKNQGQVKQQNQNIMEQQQTKNKEKNVIVFIPLTIPSTGKSTLFNKIKQNLKDYYIQILSSDTVRNVKMQQLMKKQKNISKEAAFQKTRQSANKQFYMELNQILKRMQQCKQFNKFILFMDKNHPQNALKKTIQQIRRAADKCKGLNVKIGCILPKCQKTISQKSKYMYPFSISYIASCMKRILSREQHQTLQGTEQKRVNVLINFANMFRNYAISDYNLSKYFNVAIRLPFTKEQQVSESVKSIIIKIMLASKPGSFDEHPALEQMIQQIKKQKYQEINFEDVIVQVRQIINDLFQNFSQSKINIQKLLGKQKKQQQ